MHHRSPSRARSPRRSRSYDGKRRRPFHNMKTTAICPKCLGRHDDRPDHPPPATSRPSGTTPGLPTVLGTNKDASSTRAGVHFAGISSNPVAVQVKDTTMSVPAVATPAMEPKTAPAVNTLLTCLQSRVQTPYNADGRRESLIASDLIHKYPTLIEQLIHGFRVCAPTITQSFTPPNNPSINIHCDTFNNILHKEFMKECYIGPFTQSDLESIIGPFQSSPLHIIPKPGRPRKFCLIQNLSHPGSPQLGDTLSINSQVDSAFFPCEWGTFHTACALVRDLPPGSQGATSVTVLFPHHSVLLFFHTQCLRTWRGRRLYTNTAYLFIHSTSSFCFFDLSMDLANS